MKPLLPLAKLTTMFILRQTLVSNLRLLLAGLIVLMDCFWGIAQPARANGVEEPQYIAADGTDLTAFAQCLPKRLSQPNWDRALQESRNDFIEKVFDVKDNYRDYKLDPSEVAHLDCMRQKGVIPQIER